MQVHTFSNTYLSLRRLGAGVITRILEGTQMMQLETMTAPTKKLISCGREAMYVACIKQDPWINIDNRTCYRVAVYIFLDKLGSFVHIVKWGHQVPFTCVCMRAGSS